MKKKKCPEKWEPKPGSESLSAISRDKNARRLTETQSRTETVPYGGRSEKIDWRSVSVKNSRLLRLKSQMEIIGKRPTKIIGNLVLGIRPAAGRENHPGTVAQKNGQSGFTISNCSRKSGIDMAPVSNPPCRSSVISTQSSAMLNGTAKM
jgi:hypothetical protein